jgi:hypothetical protein
MNHFSLLLYVLVAIEQYMLPSRLFEQLNETLKNLLGSGLRSLLRRDDYVS